MADFLLLAKVLLYVAAVAAGGTVAVTVGLTVGNFKGCCIFYAPIVPDIGKYDIKCSSNTNCHFPLGIGVAAMLYGGIYGIYCVYTLLGRNRNGKDMVYLPSLLLNGILSFLTLVSGCIVSVGYSTFCDHVSDVIFFGSRYGTCNYWQTTEEYLKSDNDGMPFATFMTVAQVAVWALLGVWVMLTGLTALRMRMNAKEGSSKMLSKSEGGGDVTEHTPIINDNGI